MAMKPKLLVVTVTVLLAVAVQSSRAMAVNVGDPFPPFSRQNILTPDECAYLRISPDREFSLSDLTHDIIIIEFLNVYCHTCRLQVAIFNDLFMTLQQDPDLSKRVCIIGIAVGNAPGEIKDFKKNFGALYPIFSDKEKAIFNMTGNVQGTPHTYILRKEDQRFVIDYHAGGVASKDRYLNTVKFALRGSFTGTAPGNRVPPFSLKTHRSIIDNKQLAGKKAILYFPSAKKFPVKNDTRNRGNQVRIFMDIARQFPEVQLLVFQYPGFSLPRGLTTGNVHAGDPVDAQAMSQFRPGDGPKVYFVNQYGRIAFQDEGMTLYNAEAIIKGKGEYRPVPEASQEEITDLVKRRCETGGAKVAAIEKEILDNGNAVYVIAMEPRRDGVFLFARLESKASLCDICHDSHFVYILDQDGIIRDFFPLQLTKLGNVQWSDEDTAKLKSGIVGKSIFDSFPFNPKADAVTTATMSSSLIYEALNNGKNIFSEFKIHKFRYEHWKALCLENMCSVAARIGEMQQANPALATDDALLQKVSKELKAGCPLDGTYIYLDGGMLCTNHGMLPPDCK